MSVMTMEADVSVGRRGGDIGGVASDFSGDRRSGQVRGASMSMEGMPKRNAPPECSSVLHAEDVGRSAPRAAWLTAQLPRRFRLHRRCREGVVGREVREPAD
jgi:hypothetical protein